MKERIGLYPQCEGCKFATNRGCRQYYPYQQIIIKPKLVGFLSPTMKNPKKIRTSPVRDILRITGGTNPNYNNYPGGEPPCFVSKPTE
jgi:hypothetical protein